MNASHHPSDDLLLAYCAGSLDQAMSLLIASHLTFCPACRRAVRQAEAVGGALLERLPPCQMGDDALRLVLERLDDPQPPAINPPPPGPGILPSPLRQCLGGGDDQIRWKRLARGLDQALVLESGQSRARLYRIAPGVVIPRHGHRGNEVTLVLQGGFQDGAGHYETGDVAQADADCLHSPAALPGPECICLAVTDAPLRLTGLIGRVLSPFLNL